MSRTFSSLNRTDIIEIAESDRNLLQQVDDSDDDDEFREDKPSNESDMFEVEFPKTADREMGKQ